MTDNPSRLRRVTARFPLVAILRGLPPKDAPAIGIALVEAGFRIIEVPLNGEGALQSIAALRRAVPADIVVGAGTVLTPAEADAARDAGAELLVAPNTDAAVLAEGRKLGLALMPGFFTATEAFAALSLGAHALKLFPAEVAGPQGLKALRAVLPPARGPIYAVGGVTPETLGAWHAAGADGFGLGGALYKPSLGAADVAARAKAFAQSWERVKGARGN